MGWAATGNENNTDMAKIEKSLIHPTGALGDMVFYRRFGKTYCKRRSKEFNDRRSEGQLQQRERFKAMRRTASLMGTMLQRGLTRYAHEHGMTEENMFMSMNKECFRYERGKVKIDYSELKVAYGQVGEVRVSGVRREGDRVMVRFGTWQPEDVARKTDVVHIYAVEPKEGLCELVASVERSAGAVEFELPVPDERGRWVYYLYAMAESASTACRPTVSADEKRGGREYRNINRRVSRSEFVGKVSVVV